MAGFDKAETIWFNGSFVPWDEARVHVMAHGLHYGTGVFEGLRSYGTPDGTAVFRLHEHITRMFESAAMYEMEIPYSAEQLSAATLELLRRNDLVDTYIRPIAYFDAYSLSVWPRGCPVSVAIAAMPRRGYLGAGASEGVRVCISSVRRSTRPRFRPPARPAGNTNSVRAVRDAMRRGRRGDLPESARRSRKDPARISSSSRTAGCDQRRRGRRADGHHAGVGHRARGHAGDSGARGADHG
jgi:branched-chain amino acid aminotransferase